MARTIRESTLRLSLPDGEQEASLIDDALARAEGNKAKAAALLDISERTLWYKLKKYRPEQEPD